MNRLLLTLALASCTMFSVGCVTNTTIRQNYKVDCPIDHKPELTASIEVETKL